MCRAGQRLCTPVCICAMYMYLYKWFESVTGDPFVHMPKI